MKKLFNKYSLPKKVAVNIKKVAEGCFVATFPELKGCMTEAEDVIDLIYQVNDAIYTYYDITRKDLENIDFLYSPPPDFLKRIKDLEPKPRARRTTEFHFPFFTA